MNVTSRKLTPAERRRRGNFGMDRWMAWTGQVKAYGLTRKAAVFALELAIADIEKARRTQITGEGKTLLPR